MLLVQCECWEVPPIWYLLLFVVLTYNGILTLIEICQHERLMRHCTVDAKCS